MASFVFVRSFDLSNLVKKPLFKAARFAVHSPKEKPLNSIVLRHDLREITFCLPALLSLESFAGQTIRVYANVT